MNVSSGYPFSAKRGLAALAALAVLTGCDDMATSADGASASAPAGASVTAVNRDVERPDVLSVTENALWDGRPSLGGVWVAYPANIDPERVLIRNGANGKTVIGALFRRERDNPGPKIQLSSDAAVALGVVAGSPTEISIVVLRREEVEVVVDAPEAAAIVDGNFAAPPRRGAVAAPVVAATVAPPAPTPIVDTSAASFAEIVEQTLDDVAETAEPIAEGAVAPAEAAASGGLGGLFRLRKPFIQVGTFVEEANATALLEQLSAAGVNAQVQADNPETPTLWRVVSGPYAKRSDRTAQLRIIKGLGFTDAFFFQ